MLLSPFIPPSLSLLPHVHKSVLCVCVSIAALQIGSSGPSFYISCICVNIWYLFFPFWFISLCIIGSRFIHFIRTDSNATACILNEVMCNAAGPTLQVIESHQDHNKKEEALGTSLVVQCSQCRGPCFNLWSGNWIPRAATETWHSQINK